MSVNARCALLFAELYDALPGFCIQPVEEDTVRILNHGLEITARLKAKYCIVLSAGQEKVADGETTDTYDTPFGYRTIKYTADDGFFCNDKKYFLVGYGSHRGSMGFGVGIPDSSANTAWRV